MSATTPSYAADLNIAQADSGKASGSLFSRLFSGTKSKAAAPSVPMLAVSPLPIVRSTNPAPTPTVLRIPESVAAELMRALESRDANRISNQRFAETRLQAHREQPAPVQSRTRKYSTSILETEDRGFPII